MPINWQLFRIVCVLQILLTTYFFFTSLVYFMNGNGFSLLLESVGYAIVGSLAIFALNTLNTNYPDKPVARKQKSYFNWLFLLNFLLLAFLFAIFFSAYRSYRVFISLYGTAENLPDRLKLLLIAVCSLLIFQFVILYGLYIMRRMFYSNYATAKQFDFEKGT